MIHCEREESTLLAAIHRDPHMLRIARIGGVGLGRRLIGGGVGGRLAGQAQCTTTSRGSMEDGSLEHALIAHANTE